MSQLPLVGGRADSNGDRLGFALEALKIADGDCDQIRRHLRRPVELQRVTVACWGRHVGDEPPVRDRRVATVDGQRNGEGGLEDRLVEAWKRTPGVRRFELGHGVVSAVGLAQIEAPELVVQRSAETNPNVSVSRGDRSGYGQDGRLSRTVEDGGGLLLDPAG